MILVCNYFELYSDNVVGVVVTVAVGFAVVDVVDVVI